MNSKQMRIDLAEILTQKCMEICEGKFFELLVLNESQRRKITVILRRSIFSSLDKIISEEEIEELYSLEDKFPGLLQSLLRILIDGTESDEFTETLLNLIQDKFGDVPGLNEMIEDLRDDDPLNPEED